MFQVSFVVSVVSCLALFHVELRIQEHHRLISHSVTSCDQMKTEILRKLQPHSYKNWQATKESHLGGDWQEIRGIKWSQLIFLSFCTAIIVTVSGESYQTSFQILKKILVKKPITFHCNPTQGNVFFFTRVYRQFVLWLFSPLLPFDFFPSTHAI